MGTFFPTVPCSTKSKKKEKDYDREKKKFFGVGYQILRRWSWGVFGLLWTVITRPVVLQRTTTVILR